MNLSHRRAAWATALFAGASAALAWGQTPVNSQPIILPEFNTYAARELPPAPVWHYGRVAGHEVLSSASLARTQRILDDLNRFVHALDLTGTPLLPRQPARLRLYLLARPDEFAQFARQNLPEGTEGRPDAYAFSNAENAALIIDLRARALEGFSDDAPAAATDEASELSGGAQREATATLALRTAYVRFLLEQQRPKLPPWFVEGLAQVFVFVRATENSVTLGAVENPNKTLGGATETQPGRVTLGSLRVENQKGRDSLNALWDFNTALASSALVPFPELLAQRREDFLGRDIEGSVAGTRWSKQCHAFVHWGLFGDYGAHQKPFLTLLKRLETEPLTEALFRETLGLDYTQMLAALRTHIDTCRPKVLGVRADAGQKLPPEPAFECREATLLEAARLQAIVFNLGGQPEKARDELALAYRRGERTPDLVAELALAELALNHGERARQYLELATKAHTSRPRAYVTLARLRLDERLAKPQAAGGKLSYEQLVGVLEPLLLGRQHASRSPDLYLLLAEAWSHAAIAPPAPHRALLDEGLQLYPQDAALRAACARLRPSATSP